MLDLPGEDCLVNLSALRELRAPWTTATSTTRGEALAPNEMRVVAPRIGMPTTRPKQAAACWLVELGNGDKFLFDLGAGCHERIAVQKIPYDFIDKVFLSHLHVDHYGDLGAFCLGGTTMNRLTPLLRIVTPSGFSGSENLRS